MNTVVAGVALNSNLILLIQFDSLKFATEGLTFKFQSDYINTGFERCGV